MAYSRSKISLKLVELAASDQAYRRVLDALAVAIQEAGNRVDNVAGSGDEQWEDAVVDEECDLIENLLGAALVVCQAQITAVASRALRFRKVAIAENGSFSAFGGKKDDVRALGQAISAKVPVPRVEMLWALANYFKHREEWQKLDWSKLDAQSKRTADLIGQVGLESGSTGNLRRGAEALGNSEYGRVDRFADAIDSWASDVVAACARVLH